MMEEIYQWIKSVAGDLNVAVSERQIVLLLRDYRKDKREMGPRAAKQGIKDYLYTLKEEQSGPIPY
jgi:hypothetical protein